MSIYLSNWIELKSTSNLKVKTIFLKSFINVLYLQIHTKTTEEILKETSDPLELTNQLFLYLKEKQKISSKKKMQQETVVDNNSVTTEKSNLERIAIPFVTNDFIIKILVCIKYLQNCMMSKAYLKGLVSFLSKNLNIMIKKESQIQKQSKALNFAKLEECYNNNLCFKENSNPEQKNLGILILLLRLIEINLNTSPQSIVEFKKNKNCNSLMELIEFKLISSSFSWLIIKKIFFPIGNHLITDKGLILKSQSLKKKAYLTPKIHKKKKLKSNSLQFFKRIRSPSLGRKRNNLQKEKKRKVSENVIKFNSNGNDMYKKKKEEQEKENKNEKEKEKEKENERENEKEKENEKKENQSLLELIFKMINPNYSNWDLNWIVKLVEYLINIFYSNIDNNFFNLILDRFLEIGGFQILTIIGEKLLINKQRKELIVFLQSIRNLILMPINKKFYKINNSKKTNNVKTIKWCSYKLFLEIGLSKKGIVLCQKQFLQFHQQILMQINLPNYFLIGIDYGLIKIFLNMFRFKIKNQKKLINNLIEIIEIHIMIKNKNKLKSNNVNVNHNHNHNNSNNNNNNNNNNNRNNKNYKEKNDKENRINEIFFTNF
ncbi:hypothetical protein M0812_12221 [Anaeramoeba flamelloides]|uniref:Uncharacterized protein n=1 Tax=Anaeramoeba flamelloides TaxID=1746091 RepID=A0AAV7ZPZ9_9EUKA|nr:hypothetical protein M0812_12221 [Anaeramoeba flamelloides]